MKITIQYGAGGRYSHYFLLVGLEGGRAHFLTKRFDREGNIKKPRFANRKEHGKVPTPMNVSPAEEKQTGSK